MIDLQDIHSLTDFQRNTRKHLAQLKKTGKPSVLTVNGHAELVVQDAASYQKLLDALDQAQAVEGIRRGLADVAAGRVKPAKQVFDNLRRKYNIPRAP